MPRLKPILITALAAFIAPALFALDSQNPPPASIAGPGTVNYIEGSATINGQAISPHTAHLRTLQPGQVISTTSGRAEVLLTPGIFFRLGHNSAAKMISPDLVDTVIELQHGRASVEVDQLYKQNDIHILLNHVPVQLVQTGYYEFNADTGNVLVFSGKAAAIKPNNKFVAIRAHHQLNLNQVATAKPHRFNEKAQEQSTLFRWSSLRSDYLARANRQMAGAYGPGYAPGWYWDPYMLNYTFMGAYPFYSPFGWGYYPFGYMGIGMGMGWGGYYGPGFYGPGYFGGYGGYYGGGGIHNGGHLNSGNFHRIFGGSGPVGDSGGFHGGAHIGGGMNAGGFHQAFGGGGGHAGGGGGHGR